MFRTVKRKTEWRPFAVRTGTLMLRWEDDGRADLGKMKIQNWNKVAMDKDRWKRIDEQARPQTEL
jgi:hypothetical protein